MKNKRWAVAIAASFVLAVAALIGGPAQTASAADAAATYKAKCVGCHGAKAEKSFKPEKADADLLNALLKGVKPKMPSYEASLGAEDCKALVAYMRQLRK